MMYVLDTHSIVWFLEGNRRLGNEAKKAMIDQESQLIIPTIVLVEIGFLYTRKRTKINLEHVYADIEAVGNCIIYPLDKEVVSRIPSQLNIHDAIICATAIVCRKTFSSTIAVVTRDEEIRKSGVINTIW